MVAGDVDVLKNIRAAFAKAAATCDRSAKAIVQATSELIAARKHGRRGRIARLLGRIR